MASQKRDMEFPGKYFAIDGHELYFVREPQDRLDAFLMVIGAAKKNIQIFSYMFRDDDTGREVMAALLGALDRGIDVDLMIDSFGSADTDEIFFQKLVQAGGRFHRFSSRRNMGYFVRNHQKILIADGGLALVGGFNITNNYFGRAGDESWEDFGVVISGKCVSSLSHYFVELTLLSKDGGVRFRELRKMIRDWDGGSGIFSWALGGPTNRLSPWALSLKHDLQGAERIHLAAAYFSPSQSVLRRIAKITRRGKSVLVLAGKTDNGATIPAARSLYRYLLKRGANIYEFQRQALHKKLIVIDDASYVGSANLDVRSLFINMEIMLRIENKDIADFLRADIEAMKAHSTHQTLQSHSNRSGLFTRIKQGIAYLLVNTLDYTIGRRIKFGLLKNDAALNPRIEK